MTSGELPDVQRSLVAAPDPLWAPRSTFLRQTLRALDQAPYARIVTLQAAARQATDVARTRVLYSPDQRIGELSATTWRRSRCNSERLAGSSRSSTSPGAGLRTGRHAADLSGVALISPPAMHWCERFPNSWPTRPIRSGSPPRDVHLARRQRQDPGHRGQRPAHRRNGGDPVALRRAGASGGCRHRTVRGSGRPQGEPGGRGTGGRLRHLAGEASTHHPAGRRYGEPVTVQVRTTASLAPRPTW